MFWYISKNVAALIGAHLKMQFEINKYVLYRMTDIPTDQMNYILDNSLAKESSYKIQPTILDSNGYSCFLFRF